MIDYFQKNKIAVFSDLHIGVHQNSKYWHNIAKEWAEWIIADLKARYICDIVFCGDFFHTRDEVNVDTLHFGSQLLEMFNDFKVTLITGNHDCYLKDSSSINSLTPFANWSNINVVSSTQYITSHSKKYALVPWGDEVTELDPVDVIFGHFEIKLFKMNSFAICDSGVESQDLLAKAPLTLTGHFHLRDERNYPNGKILYVGNPFQMDFNDTGSTKGYYILDLESSKCEFIENVLSPKHHNILLSELIAFGNITERVKQLFFNNLVKLKIDRRISPEDTDFLINKLRNLSPAQFTIDYDFVKSDYDLEEEKRDLSGINIEQAITEFIELMDINNKSEVLAKTLEVFSRVK